MTSNKKMLLLFRSKKCLPALLAILLAVYITGCSNEKDKTEYTSDIRIEASTAFYPMAETIMEHIYESVDFDGQIIKPVTISDGQIVTPVATSAGFADLSSGNADLLISSIPNDQQQKLLNQSGREYEYIPLITEPLVILVNKNNPVDSVSMEQLRSMYRENALNWSEYGGNDLSVITYQLEEGNGSQTAFSRYVNCMKEEENHREIQTMNAIIDAVAADESGICYAFSSYYFRGYPGMNAKVVQVDGKDFDEPGYPLTCAVSAYFCKDNRNPELRRIVEFLQSEEGRESAEENGILNSRKFRAK